MFISDSHNNLVREVNAGTGLISTVAGTGTAGYNGDGIAATSAELNSPAGLAVDSAGNLFIVDNTNQRVREVSASTGLISTVVGTGFPGYNGDGIPAGSADLNYSVGLALDSAGDLFIGDLENNRVREVASGAAAVTVDAGHATRVRHRCGGRVQRQSVLRDGNGRGSRGRRRQHARQHFGGRAPDAHLLCRHDRERERRWPVAPTAAGTYTVVASFPGSQDYADRQRVGTRSRSRRPCR